MNIERDEIWDFPRLSIKDVESFPVSSGIYFVFQENDLIYIGKAEKNFRKRWKAHHRFPQFEQLSGCEISFFEIKENVPEVEKQLIAQYRPPVNDSRVPMQSKQARSDGQKPLEGMSLEELLRLNPGLSKEDLAFIVSKKKSVVDRWFVKTGTKRNPGKNQELMFEFAHWFFAGGFDCDLPEPQMVRDFKSIAKKMKESDSGASH